MATATRKAPPTHPTVWIGLGLAAVGLLLAMFAYSGTRVYNIVFAIVALVGAILAIAGILLAAWGRAVMSARLARARRGLMKEDAMKLQDALEPQPPTVAAPREKRRLVNVRGMMEKARSMRGAGRRAEGGGSETAAAVIVTEVPPPAAPSPPPSMEKLHLECPACSTRFVTEGHRPFVATCPVCKHAETVE